MGQMPNQLIRRTKAKQRRSKRRTARHDAEKRLAQLERELRSNEERWRALIDNPVMGITVLDRDHRFLMTNSTYQAMTGYNDDELKEITPLDITPVDQREANQKFFREVERGDRQHYQLIKQLVRKDGKTIWIQLYVFAIHDRAPAGPHLCAMIFDITEKVQAQEEVARRTNELIKVNEELSKEIVERKRSEEQLRRSEAYLAQAQRLSRTGSFGWTPSSGEIHWSDESFRIFALDPKVKPTVDVVLEHVHPDDREVVRRAIRETSQGEKDLDIMHRIVTPDGSVKHVHVLSRTMMDMAGNPEIVGAITDVTERVMHEQVLRLNDERYRFLFDHMPIALWRVSSEVVPALLKDLRSRGIVDVKRYLDENPDDVYQAMEGTRVTEVNQRALQVFGARDTSELLGSATRCWKNSAETYKKILAARFNGEEAVQLETHLTTLDGRTVHGLYFHMSFPLALRGPGVSLGGFLDETDRLRAQSRLAAIISSSDDAIIGKATDGIVTSWNVGATNIFGYEAHEMIGRPITCIIPSELQAEEAEILRRIGQGGRIKNYKTVRHGKDGKRIDISLTVSPVLDQSGKVIGASMVARDITAEKRAEAELQQVRDELARVARVTTLGELTAAIAHEVNQPLTAVISSGNACLRWLSHETPKAEAARKSVERVISEGNRAAQVIKRLRALVQKAPALRERLSINEAITEVLPIIDVEIRRNSISLRTDLASDLPRIFGDRIQLQQVILNLMLNAIDAMSGTAPPRDLLVTSARGELNGVLVAVRDSGTGLDEKSLDRLFEAFYTTKAQGMGIGLAVSRTIVQTHGGSLWARPNEPRGAVFAFTLPVNVEQAPSPPKADMSTTFSRR
jgi:PAS domain S-box-containing protein